MSPTISYFITWHVRKIPINIYEEYKEKRNKKLQEESIKKLYAVGGEGYIHSKEHFESILQSI